MLLILFWRLWLPAGDDFGQQMILTQRQGGLRRGHLLEVIQQQQQVPLAQELQHVIREGAVSGCPQAERLSDGRQDLFWIADGSQGNKTDVVSKGVSDRC